MKKLLCLLLVLTVIFQFAACSKEQSDDKSQTTTAEEVNPFEEFFEITWLTQHNSTYPEGRWDELELEEMFNVDIQVWTQDGVKGEEMAPLFAAGDIPDFYFAPGAPRPPEQQYEEGISRSIHINITFLSLCSRHKIE